MVRNTRILLVDNQRFLRLSLAQIIKIADDPVRASENGDHAIERLQAEPYDLVLLENQLPDTHSFGLFPKVQNFNPDIPVLIPQDESDLGTALKALKIGAMDCLLTEPIEPRNIIRYIRLAVYDWHRN